MCLIAFSYVELIDVIIFLMRPTVFEIHIHQSSILKIEIIVGYGFIRTSFSMLYVLLKLNILRKKNNEVAKTSLDVES